MNWPEYAKLHSLERSPANMETAYDAFYAGCAYGFSQRQSDIAWLAKAVAKYAPLVEAARTLAKAWDWPDQAVSDHHFDALSVALAALDGVGKPNV